MKPFITLAQSQTPDGTEISLHEHDGQFHLRVNRQPLMSTAATESEKVLADLACEGLRSLPKPQVLIGGLGFGFSLKRVLELVGAHAKVHVAELLPQIVAWNKEFLADVNGKLLDDRRVEVKVDDVLRVIARAPKAAYDGMLFDIDNGPVAMVKDGNDRLYERSGLDEIARILKPGCKAAFWSARQDRPFEKRLAQAGFEVESVAAKAHERARRVSHVIYVVKHGAKMLSSLNPSARVK